MYNIYSSILNDAFLILKKTLNAEGNIFLVTVHGFVSCGNSRHCQPCWVRALPVGDSQSEYPFGQKFSENFFAKRDSFKEINLDMCIYICIYVHFENEMNYYCYYFASRMKVLLRNLKYKINSIDKINSKIV